MTGLHSIFQALWSKRFRRAVALAVLTMAVLTAATHGQISESSIRFFGIGTGQQDRVRIAIDDNAPGPDASAPCDVGAGSFTVEFWMRGLSAENASSNAGGDVETFSNNWIDGNIIIDRDIWGDSGADWGISIAGGFVRFGTGFGDSGDDGEKTIEGYVDVLDDNWHHVLVVRDVSTGEMIIYVDAVEDMRSTFVSSYDDISFPNAGVSNPVTQWNPYIVLGAEKHDAGQAFPSFSGFFDELRIWNTARTPAEISGSYDQVVAANAPGLVCSYRFEEGAGMVTADSSAVGSPDGQVIAGTVGNAQWMLADDDPNNVAPIGGAYNPFDITGDGVVNVFDLLDLARSVGRLRPAVPAAMPCRHRYGNQPRQRLHSQRL